MEQQSTIDLYLGKKNKTAPNNISGIFQVAQVRAELIATKTVAFQSYFLAIFFLLSTPAALMPEELGGNWLLKLETPTSAGHPLLP